MFWIYSSKSVLCVFSQTIVFALIALVAAAAAAPGPKAAEPLPIAPVAPVKREALEDDLKEGDEEKDLKGAESAYHYSPYGYPYGGYGAYPSYYYSSVHHYPSYYPSVYRSVYPSYWW